jgi:hypothetical protein
MHVDCGVMRANLTLQQRYLSFNLVMTRELLGCGQSGVNEKHKKLAETDFTYSSIQIEQIMLS